MNDRTPTSVAGLDQLQLVIEAAPNAMLITNARGDIVLANQEAARAFGYDHAELLTLHVNALVPAESRERHGHLRDGYFEHPQRRGMGAGRDLHGVRKDGSRIPVEIGLNPLLIAGESHVLASVIDITERLHEQAVAEERRQAALLEHMLRHDSLTSLPNRFELLGRLTTILDQAERDGTQAALLLLDLDHFKRVNDTLGHDVGDDLLQQVAERLMNWVRVDDIVARLGGDEFVIVLTGLSPEHDLTARLNGLMGMLSAPITVRGYEMTITASVGGAMYPVDGRSPATLLRHADAAMYRAKASGRDAMRWFDESMLDDFNEKLELSGALRQALGDGELFVVYQPQYRLSDGCLTGFEALARWNSPTFGMVSPDRFIPVAEDSGLILTLGNWVMQRACHDLVRLQRDLGVRLQMAVNMSPRQLRGRRWLEQILETVEEVGIEPSQLALEITEGLLLEDQRDILDALKALRTEGIQIVVDDFGRGYSSLSYLTRFPVDKVKIDRLFVEPIGDDPDSGAVVDAIIAIGHALKMEVVAEGVETAEQEAYLRAHGCDQVQGFRYSAGVRADEAATAPARMAQLV